MGIYKVPTGRDGQFLDIQLPDRNVICYAAPKKIKEVTNLRDEAKQAINNPIGSPRISQMLHRHCKVSLLVDDITRKTPADKILPVIIEELSAGGIPDSQIKLIVAGGMHRGMTNEEIETKVGSEMARRFQPTFHDPFSEESLTFIGESSQGTPIWLNKDVAESDVVIGIGIILLHQFAGYSGGAKIILPGVSGRQTITHNHNMISDEGVPGNLDNPFRLDMEEIASRAGLSFKVDVVLNADNEVVGVFAGDFVAEHRRAVRLYDEIYKVQVPEKADIVLTTTLPKTITFTQGAMLVVFSMPSVTRPGGTVIVGCPAFEGFSFASQGYADDLRARLTEEQICQRVKEDTIFEAGTLALLARFREKFNFLIVSENLHPEDIVTMGFSLEKSMENAVRSTFSKHGKNAKVAIIPYGFSTLPSLEI